MNTIHEKTGTETGASRVTLDRDLCKACGICIALCPEEVFDRDGQGYPVIARPDDCTSCLLCELHCPDFALEVRRPIKRRPKAATPEAIAVAHREKVHEALAGDHSVDVGGEQADVACHDEEG
jgi:2-oxoglutarate ferredoxin oxidoreductase subunit delta